MYGAIIGDIIGSPYEFCEFKNRNFKFFTKESHYTDDTILTVAIAKALLELPGKASVKRIKREVTKSIRKMCKKYPRNDYGTAFAYWLSADNPEPYNSYGNGSAMRVSAAGWLYDTIDQTRKVARATAEITHNHPEGIKGAEATASAIFLARSGFSKREIEDYIMEEFGYDITRDCDDIRPKYHFNETCQGTVPEAIICFLEGNSFEEVISLAVSLGGDADTLAAIAGSIAEAFYGVPDSFVKEAQSRLPEEFLDIIQKFEERVNVLWINS